MSYQSKIRKYTAANDSLIRALLLNPLFKVTQNGEVLTRINTNGIGLIENNEWRRADIASGDGYRVLNISIQRNGKRQRKKLRVHRIIYQAFVGELDAKKVVNHKDGNKQNNIPSNLELITPPENTAHALETLGHDPIRNAVLNWKQVEEIRLLSQQGISYNKISEQFNISKGHISEIVNYKIWNERASYETEDNTPIPF